MGWTGKREAGVVGKLAIGQVGSKKVRVDPLGSAYVVVAMRSWTVWAVQSYTPSVVDTECLDIRDDGEWAAFMLFASCLL